MAHGSGAGRGPEQPVRSPAAMVAGRSFRRKQTPVSPVPARERVDSAESEPRRGNHCQYSGSCCYQSLAEQRSTEPVSNPMEMLGCDWRLASRWVKNHPYSLGVVLNRPASHQLRDLAAEWKQGCYVKPYLKTQMQWGLSGESAAWPPGLPPEARSLPQHSWNPRQSLRCRVPARKKSAAHGEKKVPPEQLRRLHSATRAPALSVPVQRWMPTRGRTGIGSVSWNDPARLMRKAAPRSWAFFPSWSGPCRPDAEPALPLRSWARPDC